MGFRFEKSGKLLEPSAEELAAADDSSCVYVLNSGTQPDGTHYWAYIAVKPSRYKEFKRLSDEHMPIRISDYGQIIRFGFEEDVPEHVKEEMRSAHGLDDNYLSILAQKVKTEQAGFMKQQEEQRIGDIVSMLKKQQGNAG